MPVHGDHCLPHTASHTNPSTTQRHSPPCRITHNHSLQMIPPDSCRDTLHSCRLRCSRPAPNRSYSRWCIRSSWLDFRKSCCPKEIVAHSTRPAPLSPTPLPSAADTHCPPNSHKLHSSAHWYKPASTLHRCNIPASNPPAPTVHCSTSPYHTNSPSAPDDSPPCPHPHPQSHIRGLWPKNTPTAIAHSSPNSPPCKTQ